MIHHILPNTTPTIVSFASVVGYFAVWFLTPDDAPLGLELLAKIGGAVGTGSVTFFIIWYLSRKNRDLEKENQRLNESRIQEQKDRLLEKDKEIAQLKQELEKIT
jgi:hypothetical protein